MRDTNLCSGFGQYHSDTGTHPRALDTTTVSEIYQQSKAPAQVDKSKAQWAIFSTLLSRSHSKQREEGSFYALWADIDEGAPALSETSKIVSRLLEGVCALLYTSRSATVDNQKCRIIIPLSTPVSGAEYIRLQTILNNKLESAHLIPDRVNERAGQVCYLPNKGEFYASYSLEGKPLDGLNIFSIELDELSQTESINEQQRLADLEQSRIRASQRLQEGMKSPIDAFNAEFDLSLILETYGYKRLGKRFLSPNSSSKSAGVVIQGNRWISSHSSDANIGTPFEGGTSGDAFDLFTYYQHSGNRNAALKDAGSMFTTNGISMTQQNQRSYMEAQAANSDSRTRTKDFLKTVRHLYQPESLEQSYQEAANSEQWLEDSYITDDWFDQKPPDREFLIKNFLPLGVIGILAAKGGTGKSFLALQLATAIAGGYGFLGMDVPKQGKVLYLSAEDDRDECRRRLYSIMEAQENSDHFSDALDREAIKANLMIKNLVGDPMLLTTSEHRTATISKATYFVGDIVETIPDLRLIIIDTYSRFNGGQENSNEDASTFVKACEVIAKRSKATLLILAHTRKGSSGDVEDIGGGARFVDSSRWAATLHHYVDKDQAEKAGIELEEVSRNVRLKIAKDNYCGTLGNCIFLRRSDKGTLVKCQQLTFSNMAKERAEEKQNKEYEAFKPVAFEIIKDHETKGKPISANRLAKDYGGAGSNFGFYEGKVRKYIQRMLSENIIFEKKSKTAKGYTLHISDLAKSA